jgi:hypothetical protein
MMHLPLRHCRSVWIASRERHAAVANERIMFKKWFRRKQARRSLDDLIFDIAEYQRKEDLEEFCSRIAGERFYIPLEQPLPASKHHGERIVTGPDAELWTRHAEIAGKNFFTFFTSALHPGLGTAYAEIACIEALRMV